MDYRGSYEEYVHACGDDHLDADTVVLKAKAAKSSKRGESSNKKSQSSNKKKGGPSGNGTPPKDAAKPARTDNAVQKMSPYTISREKKRLGTERDGVTKRLEVVEARVKEIDAKFADASTYEEEERDVVRELQAERERLSTESAQLVQDWERLEAELDRLG